MGMSLFHQSRHSAIAPAFGKLGRPLMAQSRRPLPHGRFWPGADRLLLAAGEDSPPLAVGLAPVKLRTI
jgi:hypothetical protein